MAGSLALIPTVALAEAPSSSAKKPIYDDYPPLPSTVPTSPAEAADPARPSSSNDHSDSFSTASTAVAAPSHHSSLSETAIKTRRPTPTDRLAGQIRGARLWLHARAVAAEDGIDRALTRAFALERSFTGTVASVAPSRESGERLMPGAVYVLVAAMAGSVLTRNRNVLLRASTPIALGIVAANTFIPITTRNVGDLVWEWEKKVPAIADTHTSITDGIERGIYFTKVHTDLGKTWMENKISGARESVENWIKKGK